MVRRLAARGASILAALVVAAAFSVVAAGSAEAAVSCSGTITWRAEYKYGGSVAGELVIYYNETNGGTNSACFYHRGAYYGVAKPTSVQIKMCRETSTNGTTKTCTAVKTSDSDDGSYKYYAGPRGVTGTRVNCVQAEGWMTIRSPETYIGGVSPRVGC